jgi:hypothetical protein
MATDPGGRILLVSSLVLAVGGFAAFVYLFLLDLNIYWIVLSPVILALYELPAAYVYWLFRRRKSLGSRRGARSEVEAGDPR